MAKREINIIPTLSIIIPVYNSESFLDECIRSVLNSTYRDFELILIDDGSTDASCSICEKFQQLDERVIVIHTNNNGAGAARNLGLELSRGTFIAFVDSDDYIHYHMYDILMSYMSDDIDIAECNYSIVYNSFKENKENYTITNSNNFRYYSALEALYENIYNLGFYTVIWNKIFRKSCINNTRFPEDTRIDDEFWTYKVIGNSRRLIKVDRELYYYRYNPNSIMHTLDMGNYQEEIQASVERIYYIDKHYSQLSFDVRKMFRYLLIHYSDMVYNSESTSKNKMIGELNRYMNNYKITYLEMVKNRVTSPWLYLSSISLLTTSKIRKIMKL